EPTRIGHDLRLVPGEKVDVETPVGLHEGQFGQHETGGWIGDAPLATDPHQLEPVAVGLPSRRQGRIGTILIDTAYLGPLERDLDTTLALHESGAGRQDGQARVVAPYPRCGRRQELTGDPVLKFGAALRFEEPFDDLLGRLSRLRRPRLEPDVRLVCRPGARDGCDDPRRGRVRYAGTTTDEAHDQCDSGGG